MLLYWIICFSLHIFIQLRNIHVKHRTLYPVQRESSILNPFSLPIFLFNVECIPATPFMKNNKMVTESVIEEVGQKKNPISLEPNVLNLHVTDEVQKKLIELKSLEPTLKEKLHLIQELQSTSFQLPVHELTPSFFLDHYDYFLNILDILLSEKQVISEVLLPAFHLRPSPYQSELHSSLLSMHQLFLDHQTLAQASILKLQKLFFCQYSINMSHIVQLRPQFQILKNLTVVVGTTEMTTLTTHLPLKTGKLSRTPKVKWAFQVKNPSLVVHFSKFLNTLMAMKKDLVTAAYLINEEKKFMMEIIDDVQLKWETKYQKFNLSCEDLLHVYIGLTLEEGKTWFMNSTFGFSLNYCQFISTHSPRYMLHLTMYKKAYSHHKKKELNNLILNRVENPKAL